MQTPAQPTGPDSIMLNLAFFPFKTRDGSAPKPGSPEMSGSIQFTPEQITRLYEWACGQQPDAYGKIRISASLWREQSQTTGTQYLKGNAKTPWLANVPTPNLAQAPTPQAPTPQAPSPEAPAAPNPHSMVQPPAWYLAQTQQQAPVPQTTASPNPQSLNGNPLPAWTNQQAYQQQNGQPGSMPMQQPSVHLQQASGSQASQALPQPLAPVQAASGTPPVQPTSLPQGQAVGDNVIPF